MPSTESQAIAADTTCLSSEVTSEPVDHKLFPQASPLREIGFEGSLRVDGYMAGLIRSGDGRLIVNGGGVIDGDVSVKEALINGTVRGEIRATARVELGSSARVIGDIETPELFIQPGAVFEGRCTFVSNEVMDCKAWAATSR